jgi:hypothetical protein
MTVFWCAGMYASGSTWAYNVVCALADATGRGVEVRFANGAAELPGLEAADHDHVVKTHDLPEDAAAALLALGPRVLATIRDPRDAVASLMTYQRYRFDMALGAVNASARFATAIAERTGGLLLRYESGFTENPATVGRIAEALGLPCDAATAERIFAAHRREAVERYIGGLDTVPGVHKDPRSGDVMDHLTQWHKHHAGRSGEIGRWRRTLLPGQPQAVDAMLGDWMARNGYEPSPQWGLGFGGYTVSVGTLRIDGQ